MTLAIGARKNHWEPVEWNAFYEQIVLESCLAGVSNVALGRKYGFTAVHICNILRTKEAYEVRQRALAEVRSGSQLTIADRLSDMRTKAITRIEEMLDNADLAVEKPLAVADRAFRLIEGMGNLKAKGDSGTNVQVNIVSPEMVSRFTDALEAANKVKDLHSIEVAENVTGSTR